MTTAPSNGRRYQYVKCVDRRRLPESERHEPIITTYAPVEAMIWRHTELLFTDEDMQVALATLRQQQADAPDFRRHRSRIAEIDKALELNLQALHRGAITVDLLEQHNAPMIAERQRLVRWLHQQTEKTAGTSEIDELVDELSKTSICDLLSQLREETAGTQLMFLRKLYDKITVQQHSLTFHHKYNLIPPVTREKPYYYAPRRGITELGF